MPISLLQFSAWCNRPNPTSTTISIPLWDRERKWHLEIFEDLWNHIDVYCSCFTLVCVQQTQSYVTHLLLDARCSGVVIQLADVANDNRFQKKKNWIVSSSCVCCHWPFPGLWALNNILCIAKPLPGHAPGTVRVCMCARVRMLVLATNCFRINPQAMCLVYAESVDMNGFMESALESGNLAVSVVICCMWKCWELTLDCILVLSWFDSSSRGLIWHRYTKVHTKFSISWFMVPSFHQQIGFPRKCSHHRAMHLTLIAVLISLRLIEVAHFHGFFSSILLGLVNHL